MPPDQTEVSQERRPNAGYGEIPLTSRMIPTSATALTAAFEEDNVAKTPKDKSAKPRFFGLALSYSHVLPLYAGESPLGDTDVITGQTTCTIPEICSVYAGKMDGTANPPEDPKIKARRKPIIGPLHFPARFYLGVLGGLAV